MAILFTIIYIYIIYMCMYHIYYLWYDSINNFNNSIKLMEKREEKRDSVRMKSGSRPETSLFLSHRINRIRNKQNSIILTINDCNLFPNVFPSNMCHRIKDIFPKYPYERNYIFTWFLILYLQVFPLKKRK